MPLIVSYETHTVNSECRKQYLSPGSVGFADDLIRVDVKQRSDAHILRKQYQHWVLSVFAISVTDAIFICMFDRGPLVSTFNRMCSIKIFSHSLTLDVRNLTDGRRLNNLTKWKILRMTAYKMVSIFFIQRFFFVLLDSVLVAVNTNRQTYKHLENNILREYKQ